MKKGRSEKQLRAQIQVFMCNENVYEFYIDFILEF